MKTLGCKVNQYESAEITASLAGRVCLVDFNQPADIYLINTCAVTTEAEHKSRQLVKRARRANPEAKVIALGCYGESAATVLRAAGVDEVIGNGDKTSVAELILPKTPPVKATHITYKKRTRSAIKVQDGCDNFCSYCLIPFLRRELKSKAPSLVVAEVAAAVAAGVKEVVITGIHLGKYGVDLPSRPSLTDMLRRVLQDTGIERLRLSSLDPTEITGELIDLTAATPRLARHLHLPLQSGSDDTLAAMNRRYNTSYYLNLLAEIRKKVPEIAVTTDIIVGFPGETAERFAATLKTVERAGFRKIHVFQYSDRPPAAAAAFPSKVPRATIKERAARLRALSAKSAAAFAAAQIGKTLLVLVEEENGAQSGLTTNYLRAKFKAPYSCKGKMVPVKIVDQRGDELLGEPVST